MASSECSGVVWDASSDDRSFFCALSPAARVAEPPKINPVVLHVAAALDHAVSQTSSYVRCQRRTGRDSSSSDLIVSRLRTAASEARARAEEADAAGALLHVAETLLLPVRSSTTAGNCRDGVDADTVAVLAAAIGSLAARRNSAGDAPPAASLPDRRASVAASQVRPIGRRPTVVVLNAPPSMMSESSADILIPGGVSPAASSVCAMRGPETPAVFARSLISPVATHQVARSGVDFDGTFTINGYTVLDHIGHGAHGEVLLAYDAGSNDFRAIKSVKRRPTASGGVDRDVSAAMANSCSPRAGSLPVALAKSRSRKLRLDREVAIMKRCRHPNIVRLYEVIDDPSHDRMYMVMQYVDRGAIASLTPSGRVVSSSANREALHEHVPPSTDATSGVVSPVELAHFAGQIVSGLQYLHERGIHHRDIKPDNILLGAHDTVYLSDFGVSELLPSSDLAKNRAVLGSDEPAWQAKSVSTIAMTAPEFFDSTCPDAVVDGAAADVWALGITLYGLLYGRLPWRIGAGKASVMDQISAGRVAYPHHQCVALAVAAAIPPISPDKLADADTDTSLKADSFRRLESTSGSSARMDVDSGAGSALPRPPSAVAGGLGTPDSHHRCVANERSDNTSVAPAEARTDRAEDEPAAEVLDEAWRAFLVTVLVKDPRERPTIGRVAVALNAVKRAADAVAEAAPTTGITPNLPDQQHHPDPSSQLDDASDDTTAPTQDAAHALPPPPPPPPHSEDAPAARPTPPHPCSPSPRPTQPLQASPPSAREDSNPSHFRRVRPTAGE